MSTVNIKDFYHIRVSKEGKRIFDLFKHDNGFLCDDLRHDNNDWYDDYEAEKFLKDCVRAGHCIEADLTYFYDDNYIVGEKGIMDIKKVNG